LALTKKRILILGGGFAGVETAGEINDFLHEAVSYYHNTKKEDIHVILVEAVSTILQGFNKRLTEYAHNKLEKNGIKQTIENNEKKKFEYSWKGQSAIIRKHYGIAEVMGMKITGFWVWILWRNYYLTKMPNLEKRIRVWLDWNIDLFSRIDISRYGFKRDTSKEYRELDKVDDVW
jgi:NADH dehydrogenase FAD-containing subunit